MQLKISFCFWTMLIAMTSMGQHNEWLKKGAFTKTQINILSSYYEQDGNHSAVTGGFGTEYLTDVTPTIIVNIPVDSSKQITGDFGVDFYTSASTDNIDVRTGASRRDSRVHGTITYTQRLPVSQTTYSITGGLSSEYDVNSMSFGGSWSKESKDGNREISFSGLAYLDQWKLYRPVEFRNGQGMGTDKRSTYSFGITYSHVINKRLQALISTEFVYQEGLLSTPFHRVFFDDGFDATGLTERELINSGKSRAIESLPSIRKKIPIGFRANYYLSDLLQIRSHYRYYWDEFGIKAHTVGIETPVKLNPFFAIIPNYRFHTQTASNYFAPFGVHQQGLSEFFTSDYDLSDLSSNQFGLGIRYSPVYGIGRLKIPVVKNKVFMFKSLDLRFSRYYRSDGLDAGIVSFDLGFEF